MSVTVPMSEFAKSTVMLDGVLEAVQNGWSSEYLWQVGAFFLAVLIAWVVSHRFNAWLKRCMPPKGEQALGPRIRGYVIDIVRHVSFSLIAASVLWTLVWCIKYAHLVSGHHALIFAQLGYLVYYSYALLRLLFYALRGMAGDKLITPALTRVFTWVFWILVVLEFVGILPSVILFMEEQTIPIGKQNLTLWTAFSGLVSVLLTLGVANWLANMIESAFKSSESLAPNIKVVLGRICRWVLMVSAVLIAMSSVGIDLTILSVFGGAFGVGLGFGLQKIASNYVSGFIILLERSVKIGDFVELGGFKGKISEINTRYTVVNDSNGVANLVPNETFVTSAVKNYYHGDTLCIAKVEISVAYGCDINRAIAILSEEANRPERVSKKGWTGITSLGDSAINLEAAVWIPNIGDGTLGLRTQILINVLCRFEEEGIEVPFPQLDVRVRKSDGSVIPREEIAAAMAASQEARAA